MAMMAMEGHVAGFGGDLSAEEQAYQQAKQPAAQFLVASVGVVGVFLGANTSIKKKKVRHGCAFSTAAAQLGGFRATSGRRSA
jgi:hypothetical protein